MMIKHEKVINNLKYQIHLLYDIIPHVSRDDGEYLEAAAKTMSDALTLLKAQEPVEPVKVNRYTETDENGNWFSPETYDCGNCGVELHGKANYCHLCGKAVKWDG